MQTLLLKNVYGTKFPASGPLNFSIILTKTINIFKKIYSFLVK